MLRELRRVVHFVPDVEAARAWYARALEREPFFDSPVACVFRVGPCSLSLARSDAAVAGGDRIAVYWEVDDVDGAVERFVGLGARVMMPPANVLNVRVAQVVDPFGTVLGLSGGIPGDRDATVENQPSRSAHLVALCRALLARDERFEPMFEDRFSELFLEQEPRTLLDDAGQRQALIERRISRPLYGFFAARCGFFDEAFRRALRAGTPQVVFLGAGYDTRALRFADELGGTRVFEVDAPRTQARKQALLDESGTAVPPQLRFVAVNFKSDDFARCLAAAGFDARLPSLFLWEGVTYYLSQEAVDRTLASVRDHSAPGSGLALDYMTAPLESVSSGEPFLSHMDADAVPGWLARFGFCLRQHLDAATMAERYLTSRGGTLLERPFPAIGLAYAERG